MKSNQIKALRGKLAARYPGEPTREFQPLTDRIRRALSWMEKACLSKQDSPIRFVELWIALNALYGPPRQRLRAVATLASAGIPVGVLLAPIVPGLTTNRAHLEAVVRAAAEHEAAFLGAGVLHLEPGVREHFDGFLRAEAPDLVPLYRRLYPGACAPVRVEESLGATGADLRWRYGLADRPAAAPAPRGAAPQPARRRLAGDQLSLGL